VSATYAAIAVVVVRGLYDRCSGEMLAWNRPDGKISDMRASFTARGIPRKLSHAASKVFVLRGRYESASARCSRRTSGEPARSGIVRASFSTRWKPRAESRMRSAASRTKLEPAVSGRAISSIKAAGAAASVVSPGNPAPNSAARCNSRGGDACGDFRRAFRRRR
jgi:hypothetical protein